MPTIPILPADLASLISRLWGDHGDGRGVAREAGVDPNVVNATIDDDGALHAWWSGDGPDGLRGKVGHALSLLADRLENAGLVVDRSAGLRVVGWAAGWAEAFGGVLCLRRMVEIEDLAPWAEPVKRWREGIRVAQLQRRTPPAPNAKVDRAGWRRWQAKHGRAGR